MRNLSRFPVENSKEALFYEKLINEEENSVKCFLCSHHCVVKKNNFGICKVRFNFEGKLYTLTWGRPDGIAIDPVEKKPLFHFKPGSKVLSFGTPGCNFFCLNCQNSALSQNIKKGEFVTINQDFIEPSVIVDLASKYSVDGIAYTYSEPTIFFEYANDIIQKSKENLETSKLFHIFVTNGYLSIELLEYIVKFRLLDGINIDLKFMDDRKYKKITGGHLQPVLDSIKFIADSYIHIEVTNLVIPDENDSDEDFDKLSAFISRISNEIPLHLSRFIPHYKMKSKAPTNIDNLLKAKEIAIKNDLKYVYIGNVYSPGVENTYCPNCSILLVERNRYQSKIKLNIDKQNCKCPACGFKLNLVL